MVALALHALWAERRRWSECYAQVCRWLATRPARARTVMGRDARIPHVCGVPCVWQPRYRRPPAPPPRARIVAELCSERERLLVYALEAASASTS